METSKAIFSGPYRVYLAVRITAFLAFCFFGIAFLSAQDSEPEVYEEMYTRAKVCLENTDGDCAGIFSECASYLESLPNDTLAGSRLLELGTIRMRYGRWDAQAKELFDLAHWRNNRSESPCAIMKSQFALSQHARFMNVQDSLQVHAERALESAIACGDRTKQARAEVFVGSAFLNQSNYAEALQHFQEAESIYEALNDSSGLGGLYLDMALLYSEMHQKSKARSYTRRACEIFEATGEEMKYGVSLVDLSGDLIDVHEADSALQILEIAEPILTGKQPRAEGYMQQNFGSALFLLDRYSEAIEHYKKGLILTEKVGDISLTILLHNFMSECYLEMGKYSEAYREALISDSLSAEISKGFTRTKALLALAESAHKLKDPDKTYKAFKEYIFLTDSLFGDEKQKEIAALEQVYQFEKNQKEIEFRKQENELLSQANAASTNRNYALLAVLVLFVGFSYTLVRKQRYKIAGQKAAMRISKLEKEKLSQDVDHKSRELTSKALHIAQKNEIIQSLHDQLAALSENPSEREVKKIVNKLKLNEQQEGIWTSFTEQFTSLNPKFHKEFTNSFPDLSKGEFRLAALLRMGMGSKDIASLLNISETGLKKARYRLRKKMDLQTEDSLEVEIMKY